MLTIKDAGCKTFCGHAPLVSRSSVLTAKNYLVEMSRANINICVPVCEGVGWCGVVIAGWLVMRWVCAWRGVGWRVFMKAWWMEGVCMEVVVCWVCGMEGIGWRVCDKYR